MARVRSSVHQHCMTPNNMQLRPNIKCSGYACTMQSTPELMLLLLSLLPPQLNWHVCTVRWALPYCCMHPHTQAPSDAHCRMRRTHDIAMTLICTATCPLPPGTFCSTHPERHLACSSAHIAASCMRQWLCVMICAHTAVAVPGQQCACSSADAAVQTQRCRRSNGMQQGACVNALLPASMQHCFTAHVTEPRQQCAYSSPHVSTHLCQQACNTVSQHA
jgi:hypothetical protein